MSRVTKYVQTELRVKYGTCIPIHILIVRYSSLSAGFESCVSKKEIFQFPVNTYYLLHAYATAVLESLMFTQY